MSKRILGSYPYTPPKVTEEEALRQEYNDDGDRSLDILVSGEIPHVKSEWDKYQEDRERQIATIQEAADKKSRTFQVSEDNFTKGRTGQ